MKALQSIKNYNREIWKLVTISLIAPLAVFAQDSDEGLEELQGFTVTGSLIPGEVTSVNTPLTILGEDQIIDSGRLDVLTLLQKEVPGFVGAGNLGPTNADIGSGSTLGGSSISLRNFSTLVLLNGRRLPVSPVVAGGAGTFIDVNQFPLSAIARIDVLSDGASTTYGSDAIGGVVNIFTKRNYDGTNVGLRYGVTTEDTGGEIEEKNFSVLYGKTVGEFNIMVGAQYYEIDPMIQFQREFSTPFYGLSTSYGAHLVDGATSYELVSGIETPSDVLPVGSAATAADFQDLVDAGVYRQMTTQEVAEGYDFSQYSTLTFGQKRKNAMLSISYNDADSDLEIFTDIFYSENDTFSQLNGQPMFASFYAPVLAGNPWNPLNRDLGNFELRMRYVSKPRQYYNHATLSNFVLGAKTTIFDEIHVEMGITYGVNKLRSETQNVVDGVAFSAAVAGGYDESGNVDPDGRYAMVNGTLRPSLDPFRPAEFQPEELLEGLFGRSRGDYTSEAKGIDLKIDGSLFELASGPVKFAAILGSREEAISLTGDPKSLAGAIDDGTGWLGSTSIDPIDESRWVHSIGLELMVPVVSPEMDLGFAHQLNLTIAGRMEQHESVATSTVPKVSLVYKPIDDSFTIRASYAEGFVAPDLWTLYGPTSSGFTQPINVGGGQTFQAFSKGGSNPDLEPEESESFSIGFFYSPPSLEGLTISFDYWDIEQTGIVNSVPSNLKAISVENLGPASPYYQDVRIGDYDGALVSGPNQVFPELIQNNVFVTGGLQNLSWRTASGYDVAVNYLFPETSVGQFEFSANFVEFLDWTMLLSPDGEPYDYVGTATNAYGGTVPEYRGNASLKYSMDNFFAYIGFNYIPSVIDVGPGGEEADDPARVGSFSTFDLRLSYLFKDAGMLDGLTCTLGVNNVFNEGPPAPVNADGSKRFTFDASTDIATYDPYGRWVYAELSWDF